MNKPANHFESYEAACAAQELDPEVLLPVMHESAPEWLKKYTIAHTKLTIIAEGMRGGRKPKPGERMYYPVFFKDAQNADSGFAFTYYDYWITDTVVGARHEFFTWEDAEWFGKQFLELHKDTKLL